MVSAEERPPRRGGQVPLPLRRHPAAEPRAVVHRRPAALRAARQGPPVSAFGSQTGGRWGCLARTLRHPVQTRGHGQKCPGTRPGHSGTEAWKRPIFNLIFLFWAHGQAQGGGGACTGTPGTRSLSLRLTPLWGGGAGFGWPVGPCWSMFLRRAACCERLVTADPALLQNTLRLCVQGVWRCCVWRHRGFFVVAQFRSNVMYGITISCELNCKMVLFSKN